MSHAERVARVLSTGVIRRARRAAAAGEARQAATGLERAAGWAPSAREREWLAALAASMRLDAGDVPGNAQDQTARAFAAADRAWQRGDEPHGRRMLIRAATIAFSPARHLAQELSPLSTGPEEFLDVLRGSAAWTRLTRPRGRVSRARRPRPGGGGPVRVLVVSDGDTRFVTELFATVGPGQAEVGYLDLPGWAAQRGLSLPLRPGDQISARLDPDIERAPWAVALAAELEPADVVWIEWCQRSAVLVSLLDPGPRRVVARLHSFEAFSLFPHLVDPSRVDRLVTVSAPFAGLATDVVPDLAGLGGGPAVVGNLVRPERFASVGRAQDEPPTLGLVGWASPAKDVGWALDVLGRLRRADSRWRLRLVGAPPDPGLGPGAGARSYLEAFDRRAVAPDVAGAVDVVGQVADVAGELAHVDVILSSSTRESFHLGLAEGVAAGCRPVVRDWPAIQRWGGAGAVWPPEWVVADAAQAVERILSAPNVGQPRAARERAVELLSARDAATVAAFWPTLLGE